MISIRVDQSQIDRIKEIATERGTTLAELIREVITTWIDEQSET